MASPAVIADAVPSAVAEVASSADFAGVASSADFTGFVDSCGMFETEYGDGVRAPGVCDEICGDFAEVASLGGHTGGVPVNVVPPVIMGGTAIAGRSHAEQCWCGNRSAFDCYRQRRTVQLQNRRQL